MKVNLKLSKEQKNTIKPLLQKWQNANPIVKQIINEIDREEIEAKYCGSLSAILLQEAYNNITNMTRYNQLIELHKYIIDKTFNN